MLLHMLWVFKTSVLYLHNGGSFQLQTSCQGGDISCCVEIPFMVTTWRRMLTVMESVEPPTLPKRAPDNDLTWPPTVSNTLWENPGYVRLIWCTKLWPWLIPFHSPPQKHKEGDNFHLFWTSVSKIPNLGLFGEDGWQDGCWSRMVSAPGANNTMRGC